MTDQPTAEHALKRLEPLVGEWTMTAQPPDSPPWPGEAKVSFEWHDSGRHLVQRWSVEMPEAPDGVAIIGCDGAKGTFVQVYTDERNVCRLYEMSIGDGEWRMWRDGEPFNQRFVAHFSEDGKTITGRFEIQEPGQDWRTDFDTVYTRVE